MDYTISNKREICQDMSVQNDFDTGSYHRMVQEIVEKKMMVYKGNYPTTEILMSRAEE